MANPATAQLEQTIREVVAKVLRFQGRTLGEQNTKATLIEPILKALGWDIGDPDEVHREFRPTGKDNPVDYALKLNRTPRLFVEAKGLGETLADRKWIVQILSYAAVAGVEWCVLTDGDEYRFYNAAALVDAEEKLFCQVKLSTAHADEIAKTLGLISRSNLEENLLDVLWSAHFVDRRVKETLRRMLDAPDKGLVRLIRKRVPKLTPKEIVQSLRRLDVRIDSPPVPRERASQGKLAIPADRKRKQLEAGRKAAVTKRLWNDTTLADLIAAGLLVPPTRLFRKYKGQEAEATLLPDGKIEFRGQIYDSSSTAGEMARESVTGQRMNTNGWTFWQCLAGDGGVVTLFDLRKKFALMKGKEA